MSETSTRKQIIEQAEDSRAALKPLFERAKLDLQYANGDQWNEDDIAELDAKRKFHWTFNLIFKHLLVTSGKERQGRSDIRALADEGSDDQMADVMSRVIKWQMANNYGAYHLSSAFLTALKLGWGWMTVDVRRELKDLLADPLGQGEIVIGQGDPFGIYPDRRWNGLNPSDSASNCQYIVNRALMPKGEIKNRYGHAIKDIDKLRKGYHILPSFLKPTYDESELIEVVERWSRGYEPRSFLVNKKTGDLIEEGEIYLRDLTGDYGDEDPNRLVSLSEYLERFVLPTEREYLDILKINQSKIKLDTLINGELLIPSGWDNPLELSVYPFIPILCYFDPVDPSWKSRVFGKTRLLVNLQELYNKLISEAVNQYIRTPWRTIMVGAANDDVKASSVLSGGNDIGVQLLRVNDVNQIKEADRNTFDPAIFNMLSYFTGLKDQISDNPDLLGQVAEKGAPGVAIQLRQQQGDLANEPIYDNMRLSMEQLATVISELTGKCYTTNKVRRIVGDEVAIPEDFTERLKDARFSFSIQLFTQSPTTRYLENMKFQELLQQGILEMPSELAEVAMELADVSPRTKERVLSFLRAAEEKAAQAQQPPGPPPVPGGAPSEAPIAEPPMEVPVEEGPPPELIAQVAEQYGVTPEEALVLLQQQAAQPA
jgi:hypothetical protein